MNKKFAFVFVHGLLGFEHYGPPQFGIDYFRDIRSLLEKKYEHIYFSRTPATGTIKQRATELAYFIDQIDADYICIIAHSMGGLDARYVITQLDPASKIKHLITLGTPHHGSPIANWVLNETGPIHSVLKRIASPGIFDLTLESCKRFNQDVTNRQDVFYESYAGSRKPDEMIPWFRFRKWSQRMQNEFGPNDSLVPTGSARWGHFFSTVRADHFELIGWNFASKNEKTLRPFDHASFYLSITESAYKRFEKTLL